MQSTSLRGELFAVTTAVQEVQRHIRHLRTHAPNSRAADRLEADVRRVMEDIDDLAAETAVLAESGSSDEPHADTACECHEPVFVPARHDEPEFQPECDDEGVAGGWQRHRAVSPRRRRRARV
ncbi:hypothetical protein [Candidatus Protofrankia californiensis]|uniref:hypothetical protein n=1 Tax=Candidatus Protofrankia californiensis TaxID=1839754 RepID=UPI0010417C61|nr:hypothetical protein [Candidatus Protofrankia californiensis]